MELRQVPNLVIKMKEVIAYLESQKFYERNHEKTVILLLKFKTYR